MNRYLSRPAAGSEQDAAAFIEKILQGTKDTKWRYWIIEDNTGAAAGTICLFNFSTDMKTAEIGYELLPECQGRGYASGAVQQVILIAWEQLQLERLLAFSHKNNHSSSRLLEKSGFVLSTNTSTDAPPDHVCYVLKKN